MSEPQSPPSTPSASSSSFVVRSALIAALGGLLFGFDTAVISGTVESLKEVFQLNDFFLGFTAGFALFGTILGAATAQWPSNRFGRKPTLFLMAVFYFVSAVGSAFPWDWYSFLFFRFLGGIAVGAASVVSPVYTAEISPARRRGLLVAFTQFNIVFGILLAYLSNYLIGTLNLGATEWRWMFGVEAFPAAAFFFLLFLVPESPRWLIARGRVDEARPILDALGTDTGNVDEEIRVIRQALDEERQGSRERLFVWRFRIPIMLAICIAAFNQLSGINAIMYYGPSIFRIAGASKESALFFLVIIGVTNLVFTMAAMYVIDWFGRKKLMLAGSFGYIISLGVVAAAFTIFAPQFNLSIKDVAFKDAVQKVEDAQKALDAALPGEIEFRTRDLEEAEKAKGKAETELKDAGRVYAKSMGAEYQERDEDTIDPEAELENLRKELREQGLDDTDASVSITVVKGTDVVPKTGVYVVLGGLMLFIAAHAFGQGACIWVFISEIFPNSVRAQGQALGAFVHWSLNAVVTVVFLKLVGLFGPSSVFALFCGMMVLQLFWVIFFMPETKQVPLEEMQKLLKTGEN